MANDPFKPTNSAIAKRKGNALTLYQYSFPAGTKLATALSWALKHSIQRFDSSSSSAAAGSSGVKDHIPGGIRTKPKALYREVSLVWRRSTKSLIAHSVKLLLCVLSSHYLNRAIAKAFGYSSVLSTY